MVQHRVALTVSVGDVTHLNAIIFRQLIGGFSFGRHQLHAHNTPKGNRGALHLIEPHNQIKHRHAQVKAIQRHSSDCPQVNQLMLVQVQTQNQHRQGREQSENI